MADKKISALPVATTPLAGTEVLPIVQTGTTDKVTVANLTAGRDIGTKNITTTSGRVQINFDGSAGNPAFDLRNSNGPQWELYTPTSDNSLKLDVWVPGQRDSVFSIQNIAGSHNFTLNTGNLVIGTAGEGIDFSADSSAAGMTSELLDDYEEGTWTPVRNGFTENIGGGSITNTGAYTKIGRTVFVTARIACAGGATLAASSGAGSFLSGCPFSTSTNVPGSYVNSSTIADFGGILMAGTLMYVTNSWSADSHVWVFSATFNT
jgi:hypothetical protein